MTEKIITLLGAMMMALGTAGAQSYDRAEVQMPWLTSTNAAGIRQDTLTASNARIYGGAEGGDFRATYEAESAWKAGVSTESVRHLERFSMKGAFSFEQTQGQGMCGSMFIRPGFYPVDVLEFTPGLKTLQKYAFDGSISIDLTDHFRIGGLMDFASANYAKRKDLRHDNYRLDMTFAPSLVYHSGRTAIGLSYIFSKNSETVKAEQIGTSESSYHAFLDKGILFGHDEIWNGSGVHLAEAGVNGFPVMETVNGFGLQLQQGGLFGELTLRSRSGQIGEKQFIWYRFPGWDASADICYTLDALDGGRHIFGIHADVIGQRNYETILEKVTSGGVTTTVEHGSNQIYSRTHAYAGASYDMVSGLWLIRAEAGMSVRKGLASVMYPYIDEQSVNVLSASASVSRSIGRIDLIGRAGVSGGGVRESSSMADQDSGVMGAPVRLDEYNDAYVEWLTALQYRLGLGLRCRIWHGIYAEIGGGLHAAPSASVAAGTTRWAGSAAIGYDF